MLTFSVTGDAPVEKFKFPSKENDIDTGGSGEVGVVCTRLFSAMSAYGKTPNSYLTSKFVPGDHSRLVMS